MDQVKSNDLSLQFALPTITASSLEQQVKQLIQQRGALRHITEHSLQAEIDKPKATTAGSEDEDKIYDAASEAGSDAERPQARQEKLWKAREEMLQKLAYAQNEILSALDFVSLLLSGGSVAAQASMSPALKQHVPAGTVEGRVIDKQDSSAAVLHRSNQVSEGWKSESFKSAASKLDQAAERLESEAERQSKFWDQIASLKTNGWSISRLPSDSRAIGVHYGFPGASAQFRNKGFALLQQDESGDLQLDARSTPETTAAVRVAIIRNGIATGSSQLQSWHQRQSDENKISEQITMARDALFEEELFHEISHETRLIVNQGARILPKSVELDIDAHTQIRLIQSSLEEFPTTLGEGSDDRLAESIILTMRLLLLLEHTKSRQRRSRPPPIMSLIPQPQPEYAILRPVLANLRHTASIFALSSACNLFKSCFEQAGFKFEYQVDETKASKEYTDVQRLRRPAQSLLTVRVEDGRKIELEVETYLGPPLYGTLFRSHDQDFGFIRVHAINSTALNEAVDHLAHALTFELIGRIPNLDIPRPHSGEVVFKGNEAVTAIVNVRPQRISLLVNQKKRTIYIWRPSGFQCVPGSVEQESRSLRDVAEELNSLGR